MFLELARRHGDFAIAGLAFQLLLEEGIIADGRLAYFASEDRPTLALRTLAAIKGQRLGPATAEAAVAALAGDLPQSITRRRAPRCGSIYKAS